MFLMRADLLRWQVGGGWALDIESFLGPVKWYRADRRKMHAAATRGSSLMFPKALIPKAVESIIIQYGFVKE
jgi:hypothetical protein